MNDLFLIAGRREIKQAGMQEKEHVTGMLSPYRVLDLTDEKGLLCGKLLGDLGADVIKVERPGGDPTRNIGPFYHDEIDPEKSLFWWAFNTSKRGITLDIETPDGREAFKKLVKTSDFIVESFTPGYLDKLGLGYSALEKLNPGIIMTSITPFGQTGPYRDYKTADIVSWAMGGQMYLWGDTDRPPFRISHHSQAYLHAGAEAAVGTLMALQYREMTGRGQNVDVSIQSCVAQIVSIVGWDMMNVNQKRGGLISNTNIRQTRVWPCKDGYVIWIYFGGAGGIRRNLPLVRWMEKARMANDFLKDFDWETFDYTTATQDIVDQLEESTRKFFMLHTKAELMEGALKYRAMLYPVSTTKDLLESAQLTARGFWTEVAHPELGTTITYPGSFIQTSASCSRISRRAPLIGEHNQQIHEELSIPREKPLIFNMAEAPPVKITPKSAQVNLQKKPLEGIKIIDFTWVFTGPKTTKALSDYGAMVIKIESESRPDALRTTAPFKNNNIGFNRSGLFAQDNTGKLSITLNLAHPKGVDLAKKLVAWADIVVENFAGGVMERMGLGYKDLKKIKPDIIMLSSCMQGQTGPNANHPGLGHQLTALSGFCHITGWPDREPPYLGTYTDYIAPRFCVLAILAALDYRRRNGKGQFIDISQYENGVQFLAPIILDY